MEFAIACVDDIDELAGVEVESKIQSFTNPEPYTINFDSRKYRWQTYFDGQSPASAKPERITIKAIDEGEIVGYISGHLTSRHDKDAEIQSFYLLKAYQRKGIGTQLLLRFLQWLKHHHAKSLCVGIELNNPYQQFYIKYGGSYINPHWIAWNNLDALEAVLSKNEPN